MNKETFHGSSLEYFSSCLIGQDKSPRSVSNPIIGDWNGIIVISLGQDLSTGILVLQVGQLKSLFVRLPSISGCLPFWDPE